MISRDIFLQLLVRQGDEMKESKAVEVICRVSSLLRTGQIKRNTKETDMVLGGIFEVSSSVFSGAIFPD